MEKKIPTKGYGRSYGYRCIMWKNGKCNSDYNRGKECDGRVADDVFSRETPVEICGELIAEKDRNSPNDTVSFSGFCNQIHKIKIKDLVYIHKQEEVKE